MIDSNTLTNLVSSLGFPIVAFILMYYMANSSIKKNTKAIGELTKAIYEMRRK